MYDKKTLIDTAMGRTDADIILKNGNIIDVFTGKTIKGDVAVKNGYICGVGEYSGKNELDINGRYIMPGFIDTHVHIESSMVTPPEYIKTVLPHGVTTVIADPHEITNVCGEAGLSYMKRAADGLPIKYMLPSCVPAAPFEHTGAKLDAADTKRLLPEFFGLGEMMNYPGVVSCDPDVLGKLEDVPIDGHAPLLSGHELDAYLCAGIKTDHECSEIDEMLEKISKGMYVALREGTLSKDISKLAPGIDRRAARRCTFCTDDRFIGEIYRDGSIDYSIQKAVEFGISPEDAIAIATINAAECYGLKQLGAIAPSYKADIVIADDICAENIYMVIKDGEIAVLEGKLIKDIPSCNPDNSVTDTVYLDKVDADFFRYKPEKEEFDAIELIPEAIITKRVKTKLHDGLSKVCVIERHKRLGTKGFAYVTNYGIKNAALAMSIGHDSHNIIVIGDNDADMAAAVNTLGTSGGIALCSGEQVLGYLPLEIAGLMSSKSTKEVTELHDKIYMLCRDCGVAEGIDPFLAPAFLPLPVIPDIRITDSGLFDVVNFSFIG